MLKYFLPPVEDNLVPYSYRARAIIPAKHFEMGKVIETLEDIHDNDIVVLGKKHNAEHTEYLKRNNKPFIFDISDDKFALFGDLWKQTCKDAVLITTTCSTLGNVIKEHTGKNSVVIPDPTEREEEEAKFEIKDNMKVVYYGSEGNMRDIKLFTFYETLNRVKPTSLTIITNKLDRPLVKNHPKYRAKLTKPQEYELEKEMDWMWSLLTDWTFEKQARLVRESNLVVLPTSTKNIMTKSKGNNRPVDALRMGRFVITTPGCPSWEDLRKFIWVGDISQGYKWALNNPFEVVSLIKKGQKFIRENYEPKIIAEQWKEVYYKAQLVGSI